MAQKTTKTEGVNIYAKLQQVSSALRAPKNQRNNFGKYNYRNVEDILEAAKPLLTDAGLALYLSDTIEPIGDRYYLKATAIVSDGVESITAYGYAREGDTKSGMDVAQITGACSSYARKYALCGLFCISGGADFDAMDNTKEGQPKKATAEEIEAVKYELEHLNTIDGMSAYWKTLSKEVQDATKPLFTHRRTEIEGLTFGSR